jgi:hypothetical protein
MTIKFLTGASMLCAMQMVDPGFFTLFPQIERLTLQGALILAVFVLWRSLQRKDSQNAALVEAKELQITKLVETTTAALITGAETQRELRKIVEESTIAKRDLTSAIEKLATSMGVLPCAAEERRDAGKRRV